MLTESSDSPSTDTPILIAGGGGFIGGWLAVDLFRQGFTNVRCVDSKPLDQWHQVVDDYDNAVLDLMLLEDCRVAVKDKTQVFNLAADMGGMGFIELNKAAWHAIEFDQHSFAPIIEGVGSREILLFVVCMCLQRRQAELS